ncbi:hypothetical protein REISMN_03510 [Rickettsia tamurae subsp. buchneri]|uniref:Uncharacterized protein n=1 Tax=Rickettsia tamurae subsp. buchneri TaxID=1462938 RepID=A0A8E1C0B2_9RICK|nr:hypothetical protein REISMN_03510 [Rickettsia tamurae subsp. buchneri]
MQIPQAKLTEHIDNLLRSFYTIGEREEDIIRLVHERVASLNSNTLFVFDNVEAYKDIEPYINGIMNMPKIRRKL